MKSLTADHIVWNLNPGRLAQKPVIFVFKTVNFVLILDLTEILQKYYRVLISASPSFS